MKHSTPNRCRVETLYRFVIVFLALVGGFFISTTSVAQESPSVDEIVPDMVQVEVPEEIVIETGEGDVEEIISTEEEIDTTVDDQTDGDISNTDVPDSCAFINFGDGEFYPIDDCSLFEGEPIPQFTINAVPVEANGVYAVGDGADMYGVPGENIFNEILTILKVEGDRYSVVDTSFKEPSRDDVLSIALQYFDQNAERAAFYTTIYFAEDRSVYMFNRFTPIVDTFNGELIFRNFIAFESYVTSHVVTPRQTLTPGNYIALQSRGGIQVSWWSHIRAFFIPTAHAFFGQNYVTRFTLTGNEMVEPNGASSILFLPGIQASRLYTKSALGMEDRLWEPIRNQDLAQLAMTSEGKSVNQVYTRDVIGGVFGLSVTIYGKFLQWLEYQKEQEVIKGYVPFAYDWRYAVDDVVENGVRYENEVRSLVNQTRALADDSFTGKVTIIGHSNGGLLAKALMVALEEVDDADLVDRVILLGSPQLGTPEAIGTVLHGYDQSKVYDIVVDGDTAREVIKNLPGAYGLLPTAAYFDQTDEPVIRIDEDEFTDPLRFAYDRAITEHSVLQDFLLGVRDSRAEPKELYELGTANLDLLAKTNILHDQILDAWIAPEGVEVVEIVGTGLPTVKGFRYSQYQNRFCFGGGGPAGPTTCTVITTVKPTPIFTLDGDGTVVTTSAIGYEGEKQTFYLNIDGIAEDDRVEHASLSETPLVQNLLGDLIKSDLKAGYSFISKTSSAASSGYKVISSHSPVTITVTDKEGNVITTNFRNGQEYLTSEIPGGHYFTIGGSRYVLVPDNQEYEVLIEGTDDGLVTIELEYLDKDTQNVLQRVVVPEIKKGTKITTSVTDKEFEVLEVDLDGGGTIDQRIDPITGIVTQIQSEVGTSTPPRRSSGGGGGGKSLGQDVQGVVAGEATTLADEEYRQKLQTIVVLLQKLLSLLLAQR